MKFQEHRKNCFVRTLSLALAGVLLITNSAWAQMLEEIVVTAQKRAEDLQDTPIAVTAFTGEQLQQAGVFDSIALSNVVPNVTGMQFLSIYAAFPSRNAGIPRTRPPRSTWTAPWCRACPASMPISMTLNA